MAIGCTISVTTSYEYNFDNIRFILEKGRDLGFLYYTDQPSGRDYRLITIDDALTGLQKRDAERMFFPILIEMQDTNAKISLFEQNGKLQVGFSFMSSTWSKVYVAEQEDVDAQRYALALLNFTKDFKIISFVVNREEYWL